jgi:hypothetical protein
VHGNGKKLTTNGQLGWASSHFENACTEALYEFIPSVVEIGGTKLR